MRRIISFFIFFPGKGIWTRVSNSAAVHDEQEGMHSQPRKNPVVILCMLPICLYPLLKKRGREEPAFLKDVCDIENIYIFNYFSNESEFLTFIYLLFRVRNNK